MSENMIPFRTLERLRRLRALVARPCLMSTLRAFPTVVRSFSLVFAVMGLLSSGCMIGPDYCGPPIPFLTGDYDDVRPSNELEREAGLEGIDKAEGAEEIETPEPIVAAQPTEQELSQWWCSFNDPVLDGLVGDMLSQNLTLRESAARIAQSRANLGVVKSSFWPQIDMDGLYSTQKTSTGLSGFGLVPGVDSTNDLWSWGTNLAWEIDVFGRIARLTEAACADVDAEIETYRDTRVLLVADVARVYIDARTAQENIRITLQNIQLQNQTRRIALAKAKIGTQGGLNLAQAEAELSRTRSTLPSLQASYRVAVNRLSVLLGHPPGYVNDVLAEVHPIPEPPTTIAVGIPAELLRRRPDIRAAERRLAAQNARIGAAEGDLYPQFSIVGSFGLDARHFSQMWQGNSINAAVGPSFRWNVLNFGRYRCNVVAQETIRNQLAFRYQLTVLQAAEEVDNALVAFVREKERSRQLADTVDRYALAFEMSTDLQKAGHADFQRVIDSQRLLLESERQKVESESNVSRNAVLLFRSLGGGW